MITIWKYPLIVDNFQFIKLPKDSRILTVQQQQGTLCMWALVDPEKEREEYTVWVIGTGHPMPEVKYLHYIDTVQQMNGALVWHIFIELKMGLMVEV